MTDESICEKCGKSFAIGDWPFCPHGQGSNGVVGDEIDVEVRHGLCNDDGTPRRFRSRTEMAATAKAAGLTNYVATDRTPGPPTHGISFGYGHTKGRTQR